VEHLEQARPRLSSATPLVVGTGGSYSATVEHLEQARPRLSSATPMVVGTGGSYSATVEHLEQARPRLSSVTPLVVGTGGSNSGITGKPTKTKHRVAGRKRASDYFNGDELSSEVARVSARARISNAPRSVLHQAPSSPVDAQGENLPVMSRIAHKIQHEAPNIYSAILAKLDCHSN
jgi:hypothetical protein